MPSPFYRCGIETRMQIWLSWTEALGPAPPCQWSLLCGLTLDFRLEPWERPSYLGFLLTISLVLRRLCQHPREMQNGKNGSFRAWRPWGYAICPLLAPGCSWCWTKRTGKGDWQLCRLSWVGLKWELANCPKTESISMLCFLSGVLSFWFRGKSWKVGILTPIMHCFFD